MVSRACSWHVSQRITCNGPANISTQDPIPTQPRISCAVRSGRACDGRHSGTRHCRTKRISGKREVSRIAVRKHATIVQTGHATSEIGHEYGGIPANWCRSTSKASRWQAWQNLEVHGHCNTRCSARGTVSAVEVTTDTQDWGQFGQATDKVAA